MRNIFKALTRSWRSTALLATLALLAASSPALGDPTIKYSTYLGGSLSDRGTAVAARAGSTFVAGITRSTDYPVVGVSSSKPLDPLSDDVFVTALDSTGAPLYSTYVPTLDADHKSLVGIGLTPGGPPNSGYVYLVTEALLTEDTLINITRLSYSGTVDWKQSSDIGRAYAFGMTVDANGNTYITGRDYSEGPDSQFFNRVFLWKIGPGGSTVYWTYLDGNNLDTGRDVAVDSAGNVYLTGVTLSTDLPGAYGQPVPGGYNAFVTKLDPAGAVLWTTYLGGGGYDEGDKIAVAADNSVVVAGTTQSADFPTLSAIQTSLNGSQDLFLARLTPYGSLISSTYLGGSGSDAVNDLALEPASILLAVDSPGSDSPLRAPLDPACDLHFIAKLDATASRVLDASCRGDAVAADSTGVSVTGTADGALPVVNAWQPAPAGGGDAFAMKVVLNHPPNCSGAVASPGTLWPAGGNFVSVVIHGVTDPEGDAATIAFTSIFQDEWYTYFGQPDAYGLGTSTARLRASRLNGGDGRVYHLTFTATDPRGATCTGTVKVCVPIVQGGVCVDGGARVNSTQSY